MGPYATEKSVPRWLMILGAVAVFALIAGFVTFGGADMGGGMGTGMDAAGALRH